MKLPLQTIYRDCPRSEALETLIGVEAAKLEHFYARIVSCRVLVEQPHRHRRSGAPFHVRIELAVPGEELVISHEPSLRARLLGEEVPRIDKSAEVDAERKNAERAVRDAFRKAARRLQAYVRRKSGV
jgi:hypothetical protein